MNFHWPNHHYREENARLRDENIRLGTAVILLGNALEHALRPKRERRRDAGSYQLKHRGHVEALEALTAGLDVHERAAAVERAKGRAA